MAEFFDIMLEPFVACLVLTAMHSYLGFHVIEREVIFVDLALAQMAALGATLGFFFGLELHTTGNYFVSVTLALCGAVVLACTRFRKPIVPHESIIGIVYAVSAAGAVLILSSSPEGGEELRNLLVGHLLFVDWQELRSIFILYGAVGIFHWVFRQRFFQISMQVEQAFSGGIPVRLWDFLFYSSFAFVVTSSVELAGVLLVFCFLVAPAICGKLLGSSISERLWWGWLTSLVTSIAGVTLSYFLDLPTGAAVVCAFGGAVVVCALVRTIRAATN